MWIINPRLPPSADTGSNSSGTRRSSSNTTFSCLTSLMHGPLPGGSFQLTYCGSSDARPNRMGIATFIFLPEKEKEKIPKYPFSEARTRLERPEWWVMEAVRLKVSRYIYCHRQSVSVIGDSLSRLDGKKIWKHYERTLPWEGSGGVRCDRGSQSFWRDKKRNNGVRQTCYLDMSSIVTCFPCKEPYMKLCGVRQRSCVDRSL